MKNKKVLVLGVGAQGTAAAKRLERDDNVAELICAGRSQDQVDHLVQGMSKGSGIVLDAQDRSAVVNAAIGVDLIVNALPLEHTANVLEAALESESNYQDYAGTVSLHPDWVENFRIQLRDYSPRFEKIGKLALIGTGSAPGLICVATRDAMRYLDTCDTIYNFVWEGVRPKRFLPFWWSPETALHDMSERGYAVIDGELVRTPAYEMEVKRQYKHMDEEITFVEHCHDEPIQYYFNREEYFKGCKNVYFKYAGDGVDFCKPLYRAGLLSHNKEKVGSNLIAPFDVVLKHVPPAPRWAEDIEEILEEGLICDSGCMAIEAYGEKDGKKVLVETQVSAPGLAESFRREGISAEMYLTGQGGYLFSRLFLEGKLDQTGLILSDMLTMDQVDDYFKYAKELDITLSTRVREI